MRHAGWKLDLDHGYDWKYREKAPIDDRFYVSVHDRDGAGWRYSVGRVWYWQNEPARVITSEPFEDGVEAAAGRIPIRLWPAPARPSTGLSAVALSTLPYAMATPTAN